MKKIKFKKFLVLFSLLICVFCMTACSSSNGTISTASAKTELKQQQLDASDFAHDHYANQPADDPAVDGDTPFPDAEDAH